MGTVFVLGAGFTRAFVPQAPLVEDEYEVEPLLERFKPFPSASYVLDLELRTAPTGRVNIERLMTRLDGGMPYDSDANIGQLRLLLTELRRLLVKHLSLAARGPCHTAELIDISRHCIHNRITCITFNYDDVFDRALWQVERVEDEIYGRPYWHPDGGYGFFCKPSLSSVYQTRVFMDRSAMLLLKLHGSMNWRPKRGARQPYAVDDIVHHEPWLPLERISPELVNLDAIESHLETEPFLVPPVIMKSAFLDQPILRHTWSLAYDALREADEVVFIGYSFPITDIATRFLFAEALQELDNSKITVVNYASDNGGRHTLMEAYRTIFPDMTKDQFTFGGALEWVRRLVATEGRAGNTQA